MNSQRVRLAIVVSHPIQYYTPYYRAIAAEGSVHIKAFFCSRIGLDKTFDPGMGVDVAWKMDLLGGYEHEFLPGADMIATTKFSDVNNPSIAARLEAWRPDVILLHGYAHKTLLRAMWWARRHGVPVMNISDSSPFGLTTPLRKFARRIVLPHILKQYSAFLCFGDTTETFYRTYGVRTEQVFRVPIMLDESFWEFAKRKDEVRKQVRAELGSGEEDFVVLYVGKFIARKRVQDLLAALKTLKERKVARRVHVLLAGDGELRAELEERARKQNLPARFLGFVNIDELPKYYCAADVLAHPAENEPYGIIALEAAVFGLPLVLSDRVGAIGPTSIARPGENTLVHACKDVAGLADALERLADEPETCARMSRASLRLSKDHDGRMSVANTLAAINYCLETRTGARHGARVEAAS